MFQKALSNDDTENDDTESVFEVNEDTISENDDENKSNKLCEDF